MAQGTPSFAFVASCLRAIKGALAADRVTVFAFCAASMLSACVGGPQPEPPNSPGAAGTGEMRSDAGVDSSGGAGVGGIGEAGVSGSAGIGGNTDGGTKDSDASIDDGDSGIDDASCDPSTDAGVANDAACDANPADSGSLTN